MKKKKVALTDKQKLRVMRTSREWWRKAAEHSQEEHGKCVDELNLLRDKHRELATNEAKLAKQLTQLQTKYFEVRNAMKALARVVE